MAFLTWEQAIQKHGDKVPHWQQGQGTQFVTFRLGDALPLSKLKQWREARRAWLEMHPQPWDEPTKKDYERVFTAKIEDWLDEGMGSCLWRDGGRRRILEETLMRFQGERVVHHAWVIMPNHVHLLFTPGEGWVVPELIQAWKALGATDRAGIDLATELPGYSDPACGAFWECVAIYQKQSGAGAVGGWGIFVMGGWGVGGSTFC